MARLITEAIKRVFTERDRPVAHHGDLAHLAHRAKLLSQRAYEARRSGDAEAALQLYREASSGAANDPAVRAHCLRHIGDLEREAGRFAQAGAALDEAEALYRSVVSDPLSLANTIRLCALIEPSADRWKEAKMLYQKVAMQTGLDLSLAVRECDGHLGD